MLVKAVAHIRNEDVRRILNKSECEPGDVFDLADGLAEVYLRNGWVIAARGEPTIEVAAHAGAPERAVTRRGGLTRAKASTVVPSDG